MLVVQYHNIVGTFLSDVRGHTVKEGDGTERRFWVRDLTVVNDKGESQVFSLFSDLPDGLNFKPYDYTAILRLKEACIDSLEIPALVD